MTLNAMAELEAGKGERFDMAELCSEVKFSRYDSADYLKTEDDIAAYMEAVMEEGGDDPAYIATALGVVARARMLTQLANDAGMSRRELIGALTADPPASAATAAKIARALGMNLNISSPLAPSASASRR